LRRRNGVRMPSKTALCSQFSRERKQALGNNSILQSNSTCYILRSIRVGRDSGQKVMKTSNSVFNRVYGAPLVSRLTPFDVALAAEELPAEKQEPTKPASTRHSSRKRLPKSELSSFIVR
jgi:hypothetical protein